MRGKHAILLHGEGDAMKTTIEARESYKNLTLRRNFLLGCED